MNEKDRKEHAKRLNLNLKQFDNLVASSIKAYEIIKDLGPFYGKEETKEPTFRTTALPVLLPLGSKKILATLGEDLFYLAKALQKLPISIKKTLGSSLYFKIPLTWRIDAIVDKKGRLKINEIEGKDGANALMIAEQIAYGLSDLKNSTASCLVKLLKDIFPKQKAINIALILTDIPNYPHTPNARRFVNFMKQLSKEIKIEMIDENDLRNKKIKPNWSKYEVVFNETSLSPKQLFNLGVEDKQLLSAGNHSALMNKGIFALVFDKSLDNFWRQTLGEIRLKRLRDLLIPTVFIKNVFQLKQVKEKGQVVKISWAGSNTALINRSRGVAIPKGELEQSSSQRWALIEKFLRKGVRMIAQDFIEPAKLNSYLRKRGVSLEAVEWYNRVCVKYVVGQNPFKEKIPEVFLTATEVTLGPNIIPAGRESAFTAGQFKD